MSTPEQVSTREVPSHPTPCAEPPSAAESSCDARCQVPSCCQIAQNCDLERHSIRNAVGDYVPDDQGGCQRSTPGSPSNCCGPTCPDRAQEPCCQSDCDTQKLAISSQDGCCLESRPCDSPNIGCLQGAVSLAAGDGCCSDCAPGSRGQACAVITGPIADRVSHVVASTTEAGFCDCSPKGLSALGNACPIPTGIIADTEDNVVAPAAEGDCCSDCALKCPSARGQVYPIGIGRTAENKDMTVNARGVSSEYYRNGQPNIDDNLRTAGTSIKGPAYLSNHSHPRSCGKMSRSATCRSKATLRRFFEVACCCLVDRRVRPPKQRHHHHHSHSQMGSPHLEAKRLTTQTQGKNSCVSEKDHHPTITDDAAEQGVGCLQTVRLAVHGMDCPSCAAKLTRTLLTLPSVQDVKVNIFTGQASLTYREGFIFPSIIANRATKVTGFVCVVVDGPRLEGKHRILHIMFQDKTVLPYEYPVLPPGVVILQASRTETNVILDVQYDAAVIQPRAVLDIFETLGGSFLPPSRSNSSARVVTEVNSLFRRTLISAILTMPVILFSWAPLQPHPIVYGAISLFLATCIQFGVGAPLYYAAFYTLFVQHVLDMDVLIALSSTIAYVFSLVGYIMLVAGHEFSPPFFETPTLLLTLITLGKLISAYSRRRVTSALDGLGTLQPDLVQMVSVDGAMVATTHVDLVQPHDVLRVAPDTLIPTDGIVLRGSTQVDESALTGESLPVEKAPGAPLTAGTRNLTSSIDMEVNRAPAENTLAEFSAFLARMQEARLPIQDLADRAAALLAPVILAVAVVNFVIWIVVGLCVRGEHLGNASLAALRYTIAVLVVSCPCAVVLCVPMVIVTTSAVAIREGVLLKTASAIQHAKNITVAVFDKTGTLTLGQMDVVQAHIMRENAIGTILALVSQDSHPVAHAVAKYLRATYPHISAVPLPDQVQSVHGRGLEITVGNVRIRGGSPSWLGLQTEPLYSLMTEKAMTMFAVTIHTEMVAFFGLADSPRPSAAAAIETLQRQGIRVYIVSGDTQPVVCAIANQLGIPQERALGDCLPEEKVARVRALQAAGGRVMFVGDGTNDTLALAAADISISMGSGTDVARSAAEVVFLAPDLARALAALLRLSRGAVRRVYLNFAWAVIYNLSAVLLAAGALVKVRIAPEYAALGEMISVVPVMLIAWSMWILNF